MGQIEDAIAYLKALKKPNYAEAARRFSVEETTLRRRFLGVTVSREQAHQEHHQLLNKAQEDVLLSYIGKMTDKHIPPTTQIVRNLAEELIGKDVGKNWAAGFIQRHKDRICSIYLRPLDYMCVVAENVVMFKHFYRLILFISAYYEALINKILIKSGYY